jgi:phosphoribosylanthranilate isomerase
LRIKICGITNEPDAQAVAALGGDAIGLNFYPQSPRFVDVPTARSIVRSLPPFVEPVGLFVHETSEKVLQTLEPLKEVRTIQWHGQKPNPSDFPGYRLIVAFPAGDASQLSEVAKFLDSCRAAGNLPSALLVDAHVPGQYGGTGKLAPWPLLADFRPGVPLILAGGLTAENVGEAIRVVRPYAVDVASGVEKSPGVKDASKLVRFIDKAREAAAKYLSPSYTA